MNKGYGKQQASFVDWGACWTSDLSPVQDTGSNGCFEANYYSGRTRSRSVNLSFGQRVWSSLCSVTLCYAGCLCRFAVHAAWFLLALCVGYMRIQMLLQQSSRAVSLHYRHLWRQNLLICSKLWGLPVWNRLTDTKCSPLHFVTP